MLNFPPRVSPKCKNGCAQKYQIYLSNVIYLMDYSMCCIILVENQITYKISNLFFYLFCDFELIGERLIKHLDLSNRRSTDVINNWIVHVGSLPLKVCFL